MNPFNYPEFKWDENFNIIDFETISPLDTYAQTLRMDNNNFLFNTQMMGDKIIGNMNQNDNKPSREDYTDFLLNLENLQRQEFSLTENLKDKFNKLQTGENKYLEHMNENTTKETLKETIKVMREKLNYFSKFAELFDIETNNRKNLDFLLPFHPSQKEPEIKMEDESFDPKEFQEKKSIGSMDSIELTVLVQPSPQIVANRYVTPAPEVRVSLPKMEGLTYLIVAKIVYYGTEEEVLRSSSKGKREKGRPILEGIIQYPIAKNIEIISFHKIKISEVSSKHGQKPFSMLFSIGKFFFSHFFVIFIFFSQEAKEQKNCENKTIMSVYTEPFYVQSRAIKKRALPLDRSEEIANNQEFSPTQTNLPSDLKLIEITSLLVYPQKKAAKFLQISESMMCKRWKEATNRKWPFRSIQKYHKLLKQLQNENNQESKNYNQIAIIKKKLKQALDPVSISLPITKNIPPFPHVDFDNLDLVMIEEEENKNNQRITNKNKKLKITDNTSQNNPLNNPLVPGINNSPSFRDYK